MALDGARDHGIQAIQIHQKGEDIAAVARQVILIHIQIEQRKGLAKLGTLARRQASGSLKRRGKEAPAWMLHPL